MAHVITALIAIAAMLGGVLVLTEATLSSASDISISWDGMVERAGDRTRTELTLIAADESTGTIIDVSFRNSGQTALADFPEWDIVIQYYATANNADLRVVWMAHTAAADPPSGQWTVQGIYLDAATSDPEVYEPNSFNPGEEMRIRLKIDPAIPDNTDNLVTIGTPNGVTLAAPFSRTP